MKTMIVVVILAFLSVGCTNPTDAKRVLEAQGHTKIQMHGWTLFGCGQDDITHDSFVAYSVAKQYVSGTVCGGWFGKGMTVRYD